LKLIGQLSYSFHKLGLSAVTFGAIILVGCD
jgi:hypothetical protein